MGWVILSHPLLGWGEIARPLASLCLFIPNLISNGFSIRWEQKQKYMFPAYYNGGFTY